MLLKSILKFLTKNFLRKGDKQPLKLRDMFLNRTQRLQLTWEQLAEHYNICVAKGIEELGKLGPNEYDYLDTIKAEVEFRLDNPRFTINPTRTPERKPNGETN